MAMGKIGYLDFGFLGLIMDKFASLCMTAYNRPQYLQMTLESLFANTEEPFELIIHDDGSNKMQTDDILDKYRLCGATVISNMPGHNQGISVGLNRMFNMAEGDPIVKLDSDQTFSPGWLSKAVEALEKFPEIGLLGLEHYHHDPCDYHNTMIENHGEWSHHTYVLGACFAIRRETWEALGPLKKDEWGSDMGFMEAINDSGKWKVALLPESMNDTKSYMGFGKSSITLGSPNKIEILEFHDSPFIINHE